VDYVVVERDGVEGVQAAGFATETPTPTVGRIRRRSYTRRQMPAPTDVEYDSDDDDESTSSVVRSVTIPSATPSGPPPVRL